MCYFVLQMSLLHDSIYVYFSKLLWHSASFSHFQDFFFNSGTQSKLSSQQQTASVLACQLLGQLSVQVLDIVSHAMRHQGYDTAFVAPPGSLVQRHFFQRVQSIQIGSLTSTTSSPSTVFIHSSILCGTETSSTMSATCHH